MTIKSQLAPMQLIRPDSEAIKRAAWLNEGILVVSIDDPKLDWVQRQYIEQIGKLLYSWKGE